MTKETLRQLVYDLLLQYRHGASAPELWWRPVVRFTDASHPQIARLREIVHPEHHLTTDFMAAPTVIPVYFLPFSIEVINSNRGGYYASELWTHAYSHSANAVKAIDDGLVRVIQESGYLAVKPTGTSYVTPTTYKSRWSHRHIACLFRRHGHLRYEQPFADRQRLLRLPLIRRHRPSPFPGQDAAGGAVPV